MTWTNEVEFDGEGREIKRGWRLIATIYNPADADLIAAAPDLLAALTDAVAALADANYYPSELNRLQAVITKAKGN
jgi:hypothetical protein